MTKPLYSSSDLTRSRMEAKADLRNALAMYNGDPHHADVAEKISALSALNPTESPACNVELRDGNWLLISAPNFPDGERRADGTYCYSLGRLAFNMFQPADLQVVINQVFQPVLPIGNGEQRSHDIVVEFTTISDQVPALRGIVRNLGICTPKDDSTLQVQFTGGVLEPAVGVDLELWRQVFGNPQPVAPKTLKAWFQNQMLKFMFGLVPPQGIDGNTGRVEFQMKRSPKGALTILYLDEELRITRGQKETVLVCERQPTKAR